MASKYAHLKGKVPVQPTARDVALEAELEKIKDQTAQELTATYNACVEQATEIAAEAKALKLRMDALEIIIRKRIDAAGGDGIKGLNDYTWTETFEPYPVVEDIAGVVEYFQKNDPDQLKLKNTELASRLKSIVKEEATTGGLIMKTVMEKDPETGDEREVTEVRSNVPGVRVFLKPDLSRVKSSKKG